jgi:predicted transcriptional regulator
LVYRPAVPKAEYQKTSLKNLSSKLFNGAPAAMVARLVDDEDVTDEMLEEMRALLEERLGENAN